MDKIVFDKKLHSVGYPDMDQQHMKIIDLINRSIELDLGECSKAEAKDLLTEMLDYSWQHFEAEESLLSNSTLSDYPRPAI